MHVASACTSSEKKVQHDDDVSVPPPLHRGRRRPTSVSVRGQFPPRGPYRPPSPFNRTYTTPYLHLVCNLPPSKGKTVSYPSPIPAPPRTTESPKSTRVNRTYLKLSLCRNRQKVVTKLRAESILKKVCDTFPR